MKYEDKVLMFETLVTACKNKLELAYFLNLIKCGFLDPNTEENISESGHDIVKTRVMTTIDSMDKKLTDEKQNVT